MKNFILKSICVLLVFALCTEYTQAQTMGKPAGNNLNFFNTTNFGGQIGHRQSGAFGQFATSSRWIGIGQPNIPGPTELYGMRLQDRTYVGVFSLNGNQAIKDLDIQWGRTSGLTPVPVVIGGPIPAPVPIGYSPYLNFKFITSPTASQLAMRLSKNGYLETFAQVRSYAGIGNFGNFTEIAHGGSNGYINTQGAGNLDFRHDNSTKMLLTSSGVLGINKPFPSSFFRLDVGGATRNTTGFWSTSDSRYKKDVNKMTDALDKLSQLEPVTYKFKQEVIGDVDLTKTDDNTHFGFIAQDMEKVFPELVMQDEYGYYAVRYDGLIPVLVDGFKEQNEIITEQESTIAALNDKVENLEKQLANVINAINNMQDDATLRLTPSDEILDKANLQNRPNPFKGITTIDYTLPNKAAEAQLMIYNMDGKLIKSYSLSDRQGTITFDGSNLAAGTYAYQLIANGEQLAQQKMVVQ